MLGKTSSLKLQTPEGVAFNLPLASPVLRGIAIIIDYTVIVATLTFISIIILALALAGLSLPFIGEVATDLVTALYLLILFVIFVFYGAFFEWLLKGQTIGKKIMRLRVVDERGLSLNLGQILIRNLFRLVDCLPSFFYCLGGTTSIVSKRCQRLGDIAAGTVVIRELKIAQPQIGKLLEGIENSFASMPHLEGRLRQHSSPEEARIALDAVIRRDEIETAHRLHLFQEIANHFRDIAEFPEEITMGLSDEQYVRNVVDTLYRKTAT